LGAAHHRRDEIWRLYELGRDTYTPAVTALRMTLPPAAALDEVLVRDAAEDGTSVCLAGSAYAVPAHAQPAVRRQRLASTICNGPGDYPLLTILHELPRVPGRKPGPKRTR
jgi:hypothetical protein